MTWFSFATWSVMADLFISAALLFRSDRVNVLLLIDCTSFLCSSCLTQSFCWVSSTSASDCMRNATVTYLLKSPILQRWGKWKSNPESVPKTGSSQKVISVLPIDRFNRNTKFQWNRLITSVVTPQNDRQTALIAQLLAEVKRICSPQNSKQTRPRKCTGWAKKPD